MTTWMNLEDITLAEMCLTKIDKYFVISLICEIQTSQTQKQRGEEWLLGGEEMKNFPQSKDIDFQL